MQPHAVRHKLRFNRRPSISKPNNKCRNCGGQYPHDGDCPARGKDCKACGKMNHFARQCRSKQQKDTRRQYRPVDNKVRQQHSVCNVTERSNDNDSSSSDDKYIFVINSGHDKLQPQAHIKINNMEISVLIDSGAAVNIISQSVHDMMSSPLPM